MKDENDEIFGRVTEDKNISLHYSADGSAVTRLKVEGVYPVGSNLSTQHEHATGIVLSPLDAARLGVELEDGGIIARLNDQGKARVRDWVLQHAKHPERQHLPSWYSDAESDASGHESIIIEMPGLMSASGNPVVLVLDQGDFDWSAG